MALPRKVQEQEAQADALLQSLQAQTPQEEPSAQPAVASLDELGQATAPASQDPAAPQPPVAPEPPASQPAPQQPQVDWEHKFKTLQGMFNSQVPALQRQVQELQRQLEEARKASTSEPQPSKVQPDRVADPKDVETFGADLVQMVQRVAERMFLGAAQSFEARLKAIEQQLAGTATAVSRSAEEVFFARLAQLVPDWETINADARFLEWLGEEDPVYGVPRQAALNAAQQRLDPERAAAVFRAFKQLVAPAPAASDSLAKQVTPRATAPASVTPPAKPVIRQADVQKFYDDVRRGVYRGRENEAERIEKEINLALAEGRII